MPRRVSHRVVDEYVQELDDQGRLTYRKAQEGVEFSAYVRQRGYNIIPISADQQLAYGCNVLNLGNSNIIAVHEETARVIAQSPYFRGRIRYHDFSAITSMYGAVHCATQVVRRRPSGTAAPAAFDGIDGDIVQRINKRKLADDCRDSVPTFHQKRR